MSNTASWHLTQPGRLWLLYHPTNLSIALVKPWSCSFCWCREDAKYFLCRWLRLTEPGETWTIIHPRKEWCFKVVLISATLFCLGGPWAPGGTWYPSDPIPQLELGSSSPWTLLFSGCQKYAGCLPEPQGEALELLFKTLMFWSLNYKHLLCPTLLSLWRLPPLGHCEDFSVFLWYGHTCNGQSNIMECVISLCARLFLRVTNDFVMC